MAAADVQLEFVQKLFAHAAGAKEGLTALSYLKHSQTIRCYGSHGCSLTVQLDLKSWTLLNPDRAITAHATQCRNGAAARRAKYMAEKGREEKFRIQNPIAKAHVGQKCVIMIRHGQYYTDEHGHHHHSSETGQELTGKGVERLVGPGNTCKVNGACISTAFLSRNWPEPNTLATN